MGEGEWHTADAANFVLMKLFDETGVEFVEILIHASQPNNRY